jgi:replicative DNA helicase
MSIGQPIIADNLFLQEEFLLNDVGSERGLLACIMKRPALIHDAERNVPRASFSVAQNRFIYEMMLYIAQNAATQGWPVHFDAMSMLAICKYLGPQYEANFMAKTDGMDQIRGVEALIPMVEPDQFGLYVHAVTDRFCRREMYRQARALQKQCLNFQGNPDARMLALANSSELSNIAFTSSYNTDGKLMKLGDYGPDYMAKCRLQYQYPMNNLFTVPCPMLPYLSHLMNGGWRRKGLFMICARPKVGKSSLCLSIAIDSAVRQGIPTLYLDTEMSGEEMFSRGISHMSGVHEFRILKGKFMEDGNDYKAIDAGYGAICRAPFYYVNIAGKPIDYVHSIMRQFRNQVVGTREFTDQSTGQRYTFSNPALVVYDWLKLPDSAGLKNAQETQLLGFQCSAIKDAANAMDFPVVAGAQANRAAVNVSAEEWEHNAEAYVAGSDRIAQFCSALSILRNVTPAERAEHPWSAFRRRTINARPAVRVLRRCTTTRCCT